MSTGVTKDLTVRKNMVLPHPSYQAQTYFGTLRRERSIFRVAVPPVVEMTQSTALE
jgi:hypothetical protein